MLNKPVKEARQLLERFGEHLPIDVEAMIKELGLAIRTQELEDSVSGMLVIKDGRITIGVNKNHHPNRQRFTLAHELGHFLLHRNVSNIFIDASTVFFRDSTSSDGSKAQEIEANAFAAELLMPEERLRKIIRNQPLDAFDEGAVRRLGAQFGVSVQALTIRLTKLGLIETWS
jgi:Zn-dependent peptidase ImmA (M78 family)